MPVYGLTGNLGSGKSSVVKLLKAKISGYFNADSAVHKYYQDKKSLVYRKITKEFPEALRQGSICRKALGEIVFSDKKKLVKLEEITHLQVIKELKAWVRSAKKKKGVYLAEVPLLFEKNLKACFKEVILVHAPKKILVNRLMKKHGLSRKKTLSRLGLFMPFRDKIKEVNFIVKNDSNRNKLKKEVDLLWKKINQK